MIKRGEKCQILNCKIVAYFVITLRNNKLSIYASRLEIQLFAVICVFYTLSLKLNYKNNHIIYYIYKYELMTK